jgi:hypothetical protein
MERSLLGEICDEELEVNPEGEVLGGELRPKSISALNQALREQQKAEWALSWRRSPVREGLHSIDPRPPGPASVKILHFPSRRNTTLLSHVCLNFNDLGGTKPFLDASSPERFCKCGDVETRERVFMVWRRYEEARRELRRKMGKVELSMRSAFSPPSVYPLLHFPSLYPAFSTLFLSF